MKSKGSSKVIGIICVLLLIFSVVVIFMTSRATEKYDAQFMANNANIGDLMEQVAALKASADEVVTEEIASSNVKSCADLGDAVAEYQTKYQYMSALDDYDAWMENVYALDACLTEEWKNSRVPWFFAELSYDLEWKWTFQSTYQFVNKKINVLWLCHDVATGDLIGYTTGVYDSEIGLFSDIKFTYTSIGIDYIYDSPDESPDNNIESTGPINDSDEPDTEYDPSEDYTVDSSQEPDDIGGGGGVGDNDHVYEDDEESKFGDDFQDYDDYVGSDQP